MRAAEDSLKKIAFHFNVTGLAAAHIAVNRLYFDLFREDEEFVFPTAEQIAAIEANLPTDEIGKRNARDALVKGSTRLEQEVIVLFQRHLQTFDIDTFNEGTLSGMLSAWAMCGAISTTTWAALDELRAARGWQLKKPKRLRKQK